MVLTIVGKDSTDKALNTGLSLFGRKFKVQGYLTCGPDNQCNICLAFGHHTSQCTRQKTVLFVPKGTQHTSTPVAEQNVLSRATRAFTPLSNALTAKTPTK
ncbi:hypothetical protein L873DRAFT_1793301 [Choiromyces venosus 120613-1]|uniref:Uncharacterized protein n=1 Tax=Choiromyces venosus 120613-1 TaxID=1336337 RepID=A0A3N4J6V5_9PEZI|nr:hypothetical protein L873DRAFT_1793301 [Choiromyces venosus 120613-1]